MKRKYRKRKQLSPNVMSFIKDRDNLISYDYQYLEQLELMKLRDMRKYFEQRPYATDDYYDNILYWLGICIRLGECLVEDKHWTDDKYVNIKTCRNELLKDIYNTNSGIKTINLGCVQRTIDEEKISRKMVWEAKVRRLYYLVRMYYTETWTD